MLELSDKNVQAVIIKMLQQAITNMLETIKKIKNSPVKILKKEKM